MADFNDAKDDYMNDVIDFPSEIEERAKKALCEVGISSFSASMAMGYIKNGCSKEHGADRLARVLNFILDKINHAREKRYLRCLEESSPRDWQCGCPELIRGLRAIPIWNITDVPGVAILESRFEAIRSEFLAARTLNHQPSYATEVDTPATRRNLFQPYRSPKQPSPASAEHSSSSSSPAGQLSSSTANPSSDSLGALATSSGNWSVCYLSLHGLDFQQNRDAFPRATDAIKLLPRPYEHSFLSAITSRSHISKHFGPTNKKLRCMLPLVVPPVRQDTSIGAPNGRCWLRVADRKIYLEEGKCILFDDSFEHEAGFDVEEGGQPTTYLDEIGQEGLIHSEVRVVLVADIWHPDFTDEEVKIMSFIGKAQMTAAKKCSEAVSASAATSRDGLDGTTNIEHENDFLHIIMNAKKAASVPDDLIWGYTVRDD